MCLSRPLFHTFFIFGDNKNITTDKVTTWLFRSRSNHVPIKGFLQVTNRELIYFLSSLYMVCSSVFWNRCRKVTFWSTVTVSVSQREECVNDLREGQIFCILCIRIHSPIPINKSTALCVGIYNSVLIVIHVLKIRIYRILITFNTHDFIRIHIFSFVSRVLLLLFREIPLKRRLHYRSFTTYWINFLEIIINLQFSYFCWPDIG